MLRTGRKKFFISWNFNHSLNYKCICIIVKVKSSVIRGKRIRRKHILNHILFTQLKLQSNRLYKNTIRQMYRIFWVYGGFILVMMERKKSLIILWQFTISSTLYWGASQIVPHWRQLKVSFCFVRLKCVQWLWVQMKQPTGPWTHCSHTIMSNS